MCNKYAVLVPPCMLSPGLQAVRNESCEQWRVQCLQLLIEYNVDIIPFICTETTFEGYEKGLQRIPHGIDYYCSLDGYESYCKSAAEEVTIQISSMIKKGYNLVAIMGIEHSPSCAINYLYSHVGMQKRSGIFMMALKANLSEIIPDIVYIGINRRYPRKAVTLLQDKLKNTIIT